MKNEIITKKDQVNFSKSKGFTLVETLVAIFVLVIAVTGPMSAVVNSLKASFLARDQIVAFYLAQDVIEAIKNVRDNNYLVELQATSPNFGTWLKPGNQDNIPPPCINPANKTCSIDTSGLKTGNPIRFKSDHSDCSSSNKCDIFLDTTNNVFTHDDSDTSTKYKRIVYLDKIQNNGSREDELKIVVEVEWEASFLGGTRKIVVQENIYNWLNDQN